MKREFVALATAFGLAISSAPSWAIVTANSIVTAQTPRAYKAQITTASGTLPVSLVAGGANGTKVISIICSNTDTSGYNLTFSVLRSSSSYVLGTVAVAASAGSLAGSPPVSVLNQTNVPGIPLDSDGNPYLFLESTDTLQMANGSSIGAGKAISCHTVAADF
jgi:hypothetical protein